MRKQQLTVYISAENLEWLDDFVKANEYAGRSDALDGLLTYMMNNEDIENRQEIVLKKYYRAEVLTPAEYTFLLECLNRIHAPFDVMYKLYGPEGGAF